MLTQMRILSRKPKIIKGKKDCQGKSVGTGCKGTGAFLSISNNLFKRIVENTMLEAAI